MLPRMLTVEVNVLKHASNVLGHEWSGRDCRRCQGDCQMPVMFLAMNERDEDMVDQEDCQMPMF